jgi:Flp pilus assembly protein TadG
MQRNRALPPSPRRLHSLSSERGQVVGLTVLFLVVLLGMAAMVIDVGHWFVADRKAQAAADAAVLAGAQALPESTAEASALAGEYAVKNGGGTATITFGSQALPNDRITVRLERPAEAFFSKVLGVDSVQVGARATAKVTTLAEAKYVAPLVVHKDHPMLGGSGCPCFHEPTTLPLDKMGAPGAFGVLNLNNEHGGTGPPILADWILRGYQGYLPLGLYYSDPGAKFGSSNVQSALAARIGTVLLFPVFDELVGSGSNAKYNIIAWAGYRLTGFEVHGHEATIEGHFESITWEGLESSTPGTDPYFGVKGLFLIE